MAILLIRHGETAANASRVIQTPDVPLSPRGLEQARRLADRLAAERIGAILASDYQRARMTAERLSAATGASLSLEPLLRERSFGDDRGRAYADFEEDPFSAGYVPPGGESWQDLHDRVDTAWERIRVASEAVGGHLAVVTHGFVCFSLVSRHFQLLEPGSLEFANTSLTRVDPEPPHRVHLLNCTAHLNA